MKRFMAFLLACFCLNVMAEEVVTFIKQTPISSATKGYLTGSSVWGESYVSVRALMNNPDDKSCITASSSYGIKNYIFKNETEVVISARVLGFKGVPEDKWTPLVSYKWDNKDKFCRTMLRDSVLLVPLTPLVPTANLSSLGNADEPFIVIGVKVISKDEEQVSAAVSSLLSIAGAYTTGGAANTVVGLVDLAGGPAVKYLSDQVNKAFSSGADQTFTIQLSWNEIRLGLKEIPFDLVSVTRENWGRESVDDALNRLRANPKIGKTLMRFRLALDARRSVFSTDAMLTSSPDFVPRADNRIAPLEILEYPKNTPAIFNGNLASINQLLSTDSNGFFKRIESEKFPSECQNLISKVENAGFNKIDTALIVESALTGARSEWNRDPAFFTRCLGKTHLVETIAKVRGRDFIDPTRTMIDVEESGNYDAFVTPFHRAFLLKVKGALVKTGAARESDLQSIFESLPANVPWPDMSGLALTDPIVPAASEAGSPVLRMPGVGTLKVGCLTSYLIGPLSEKFIGMAIVAKNNKGEIKPYLLSMGLNPSALAQENVVAALGGIWLLDLSKDKSQLRAITVYAKYQRGGMCFTPPGSSPSIESMYTQLSAAFPVASAGN